MLDRLSNGDVTKQEAVLELNHRQCLNTLMYWKRKDEWINENNKQQ